MLIQSGMHPAVSLQVCIPAGSGGGIRHRVSIGAESFGILGKFLIAKFPCILCGIWGLWERANQSIGLTQRNLGMLLPDM